MSNQSNRESNAVFARKTLKMPSKDGNKQITKLFLNNESVEAIIAGLQDSLTKAQDGVSLSIIEGETAKGPYTMIASDGLEDRGYQKQEPQQKAYTPKQGAPASTGGYKPKSPGYKGYTK